MDIKNNYDECLTNLACSIRKYFDLPFFHKTLPLIDEELEKRQPKNVVVILLDGMGTKILENALPPDSFFRKNLKASITTVFPATTTAATTSIRTGLNPVEHGWLGWTMFIPPINKTITLFLNSEKGDDGNTCPEFIETRKNLDIITITEEINQRQKYSSIELMPFGDNAYTDLDDMLSRIKNESAKPGRKYIYAYDVEPDSTMHGFGANCTSSNKLISERSEKIAKLVEDLGEDSFVIILADHGHKNVNNIFLKDYPDLLELLERPTSIDQRAVSFKVNDKEKFAKLFNQYFGNFYKLLTKEEVIESHIFGDGQEHPFFRDTLGDFLAIATSDKCLVGPGDEALVSHHAGCTDDEVYIPIIFK